MHVSPMFIWHGWAKMLFFILFHVCYLHLEELGLLTGLKQIFSYAVSLDSLKQRPYISNMQGINSRVQLMDVYLGYHDGLLHVGNVRPFF